MRVCLLLLSSGCVWITDAEYAERISEPPPGCDLLVWFADIDGDGYGDPGNTTEACVLPSGYVSNDADCDDGDAGLSPQTQWHLDSDGDGYGSPETTSASCEQPEGYVADATDCSDTLASVNPGAQEDCATQEDDNCDGEIDELDALNCTEWFGDGDSDGYGAGESSCLCSEAPGRVSEGGDCADDDPAVSPAADEVCSDGIDNNCDGLPGDCLLDSLVTVEDDALGPLGGLARNDYAGLHLTTGDGLLGDGLTTLVVSSDRADVTDEDEGMVFLRSGLVDEPELLSTSVRLTGVSSGGRFGSSAAASDWDGDGQSDLAVGAPLTLAGSSYLFFGPVTGNRDASTADITFFGDASEDRFGWTLSAAGDVNGDDVADLLVGAYTNDAGGTSSGSVYVYLGPLTSEKPALIQIPGAYSGDRAGFSVSGAGDVDGDGLDDVLVGADRVDLTTENEGSVYVVRGPVTGLSSLADADWILRGEAEEQMLGMSVAVVGDLNGDGNADIMAAAPQSSLVYLASWSAGGDVSVSSSSFARFQAEPGAALGQSVSPVGDMDGDGTPDLVLGAPLEGDGGAAWLLYGPFSGLYTEADSTIKSSTSGATLGYALAAPGDLNGDQSPELFLSAPNSSSDPSNDDKRKTGVIWLVLGSGL